MTILQRVRYIWARVGAALLVLMPIAMWLAFRPWGLPADVLATDDGITVIDGDAGIVFQPARAAKAGVVLLPGCPVDPRAYAPLARDLAEQGYPSLIVRIPWRCASFGGLEADLDRRVLGLVADRTDTRWILVGHSRGAMHAARLAQLHAPAFAGVVLMGTSHPRDRDLTGLAIPLMKIVATNDGVAGEAQLDRRLLPSATTWVRIEGGNHSQFAYYGIQLFDGRATISRAAQQGQIQAALLQALAAVR
jgi:predicted alpha/beta-hydrolase family hydrolase